MNLKRGKRVKRKRMTVFLNRLVLTVLMLNVLTTPWGYEKPAFADEKSDSTTIDKELKDGGFESLNDSKDVYYNNDQSQYWKTDKKNIVTGLSEDSHSGSRSLSLMMDGSSFEVHQDVALTPGETIDLNLWVKGVAESTPLTISAGDEEIYSSSIKSGDWQQISTDSYTVPEGQTTTRLTFAVSGELSSLFVDDINVSDSHSSGSYEVTEEIVDENNDPIKGQSVTLENVASGEAYSKTPPTISGYTYEGYKVDSESSFVAEQPAISDVSEPHTVTMKYSKNPQSSSGDSQQIAETNESSPQITVTNTVFEETEFEKKAEINATLLDVVTATDAKDGDLTDEVKVKASNIIPGEPGIYDVTYSVSDSDGNHSDVNTQMLVVSPGMDDNNEGLYISAENKVFEKSDTVDDEALLEGVLAYDVIDLEISNDVIIESSNVESGKPGIYQVTYKIENSHGGEISTTAEIYIKDDNRVVSGSNNGPYLTSYNPVFKTTDSIDDMKDSILANAIAFDVEDGDITGDVSIISNDIVVGRPGIYTAKLSVNDTDDHLVTRDIDILIDDDYTSGSAPYIAAKNKVFGKTDSVDTGRLTDGVIGFDEIDGDLSKANDVTGNKGVTVKDNGGIAQGVPGIYFVTYEVSDNDITPNTTTETVIVVITGDATTGGIDGSPYLTAPNKVFDKADDITNDAGDLGLLKDVVAFDIEDGIISNNVVITEVNGVPTNDAASMIEGKPGIHHISYSITDMDGKVTIKEVDIFVTDSATTGGANGAPYITAPNKVYEKSDDVTNDDGVKGLKKDVVAFDVEDGELTNKVKIVKVDGVVGAPDPASSIEGKSGIHSLTYSVVDKESKTAKKDAEVLVRDTTTTGGENGAPYISGPNKVFEQSDVLTNDAGPEGLLKDMTGFDIEDGTITGDITITEVDGNATDDAASIISGNPGTYTVTYSLTDSDGNTATNKADIQVKGPTTTGGEDGKPYITASNKVYEKDDVITNLNDENGLMYEVSAFDLEDGIITKDIKITEVDGEATLDAGTAISGKSGIHTVTYSVTDKLGNETVSTVEVLVQDTTTTTTGGEDGAPYITAANKVYEQTDTITNLTDAKGLLKDVTAFDVEDGTITNQVVITKVDGEVTTDAATVMSGKPGTYEVTYEVADSDSKKTTKDVEVLVKGPTTSGGEDNAPYITAANKVFEKSDKVTNDSGAKGLLKDVAAFDVADGTITDDLKITQVDGKDTQDAGSLISGESGVHTVTYSVTDSDGKETTKVVEVFVKDSTTTGGTDGKPYISAPNKVYEKTDVITSDAGEKGLLKDVVAFDEEDGSLTNVSITQVDGIDVMDAASVMSGKPGIYKVTYSVTDSELNVTTNEAEVLVKDSTTVGGENGNPYITAPNKIYEKSDMITNDDATLGLLKDVTGFDLEDGTLTSMVKITEVDGKPTADAASEIKGKPGIYDLTYSLKDSANNLIEKTVQVFIKDEAPITEGDGPYITAADKVFETTDVVDNKALLEDVLAFDLEDGDLSADVTIKNSNVVSGTVGNYKVTYTVTDSEGNVFDKDVLVKIQDTTPPLAPVIDTIDSGTTSITGTGEPGATIEVTLPGGEVVTAPIGPDGNWEVTVPPTLNPGDIVTAIVIDSSGNESPTTTAVVTESDVTAPPAPIINPINPGTIITGTGEPGAIIEVTLPGGEVVTAPIDPDGNWTVTAPTPLEPGDIVTGIVIDSSGNESPTTTAVVGTIVTPGSQIDPPIVDPVEPGDETVTGTGEPGTTIQVTLPGGVTVTTVVNPDGSWTAHLPKPLEPGDVITVIAMDDRGNKSPEVVVTVPGYPTGITVPRTGDEDSATLPVIVMITALFAITLTRRSIRQSDEIE